MMIQTGFRHPLAEASAPAAAETPAHSLVASSQPCAVTFYRAGEAIYGQSDEAGPLYFVEFGTVRICRMTADGRRQITAFHFAGDVFGFEAGAEHQCYAESVDGAGVRVLRPLAGGSFGTNAMMAALTS